MGVLGMDLEQVMMERLGRGTEVQRGKTWQPGTKGGQVGYHNVPHCEITGTEPGVLMKMQSAQQVQSETDPLLEVRVKHDAHIEEFDVKVLEYDGASGTV
uniref:Uncharacterized protein n=1 Tax=Odontella aurita TaxID=265563 RepID=A0A7S4N8F3_9STRA|mmetsp:Transcript_51910/g.155814  ORF Transcript_51910/g.155814 Transcript_51910/m.155814 type:complete len:100 (+) Transcript_51910:650-949(+)